MKPLRAANSELIDYTTTLQFLCGHLIGEGCSVVLDERQYPVLLAFLERIAAIGDVNFRLEQCVDHRPGYSVSYDNDGTEEQEREIDRLMSELVQSLGFDAGSIKEPGVISDPAEILNRIHRQDVEQNPTSGFISDADDILADGDPDPSPAVQREMIRRYAHVHGCTPEWIARQLKLDLNFVLQEIQASSRPDRT